MIPNPFSFPSLSCFAARHLFSIVSDIYSSYIIGIEDLPLIIGSFGASAVLIYGVPSSPLAQPRNAILGHIIAAFVGVRVFYHYQSYSYCYSY